MATYLKATSLSEVFALYRSNFQNLDDLVSRSVAAAYETEQQLTQLRSADIENCDVLEVGAGQRSAFRYVLGAKNRYTGIDIEPPPTGNVLRDMIQDARERGLSRAAKNVIKNVSGLGRKYDQAMRAEVGATTFDISLLEMNAEQLTFPDESFDVVVSHNVFEHLPNPVAVMREISRVLRPGGVVHIQTHLYTSNSGAHDPRVYAGDDSVLPYWAHLRPETEHLVSPNCYVNKIRLQDYLEGFETCWPESENTPLPSGQDLPIALAKLRKEGALTDYSDLELITNVLRTVWQKPKMN